MLVPSGMRFTFAILAVIISYTWFFQPRWPSSFVAVPVVSVLILGVWKAALTGEWGVKVRALGLGFRATAIFTAAIVALIVAAGAAVGTLHERPDFLANLLMLIVWGGGQQWILQTVFLREAQRATSRRAGIFVAAVLFASLHLPNPFLTTMTLIGAVSWSKTERVNNPFWFDRTTADAPVLLYADFTRFSTVQPLRRKTNWNRALAEFETSPILSGAGADVVERSSKRG